MSLGAAASSGIPGIDAEYAGEPKRPDPWTTDTVRESLRDDGRGRVVCLAPDVCLTGPNKVPTPYMISDRCDHLVNYSKDVFHNGRRVLLFSDQGDHSKTQHVEGDEAGDGGGVKSGTNRGVCEPIDHAQNYRIEGRYVVRHLDKFWMNNRNTIGEGQFQLDMSAYATPLDDDPIPGSLRWVARDKSNDIVVADASNSPDIWVRARPAPAPAPAPAPVPPPALSPDTTPPTPPESTVEKASRWVRIGRWAAGAGEAIVDAGLAVPTLLAAPLILWPTPAAGPQEIEWERENLKRMREAEKQKQAAAAKPQTVPSQESQGARSSQDKDRSNPCILQQFSKLKCPDDQKHHAVADRAFRANARGKGGYVGGMSEGKGLAICLNGQAGTPGTEHNVATVTYNSMLNSSATNGMVSLGSAEVAGALAIQAATKGRCKATDLLEQLRPYHQSKGMGPSMWVRQGEDPLPGNQVPALGTYP